MQSSLIGKIEKAKRYAEEKDRISFSALTATLKGDHDQHTVRYADGKWQCTCSFFATQGVCSHTMALERVLGGMVPGETAA